MSAVDHIINYLPVVYVFEYFVEYLMEFELLFIDFNVYIYIDLLGLKFLFFNIITYKYYAYVVFSKLLKRIETIKY